MYKDRTIDRKIRTDFQSNPNFNYLQSIEVSGGGIRGLHPSKVEFKYPITAIAGVNGSGKSTLLALVSCAFHNTSSFVPFNKIVIIIHIVISLFLPQKKRDLSLR